MRAPRRRAAVLATAAIAFAAATAPAAAGAVDPTAGASKACRPVEARGKIWTVGGEGPPCWFMRRWTRRFLEHRAEPAGWSCRARRGGSGVCERNRGVAFFVFYPPD